MTEAEQFIIQQLVELSQILWLISEELESINKKLDKQNDNNNKLPKIPVS